MSFNNQMDESVLRANPAGPLHINPADPPKLNLQIPPR